MYKYFIVLYYLKESRGEKNLRRDIVYRKLSKNLVPIIDTFQWSVSYVLPSCH